MDINEVLGVRSCCHRLDLGVCLMDELLQGWSNLSVFREAGRDYSFFD